MPCGEGFRPGETYNRDGYDRTGYDHDGYDQFGYDKKGYDRDGRDVFGYDIFGYNREGKKKKEPEAPKQWKWGSTDPNWRESDYLNNDYWDLD